MNPVIKRVQIKNFRSLADVDLHLDNLTVLVGANGTGKSNVIDVLRFVRDAITHGLDKAILDRHGMSAIRRWSPRGAPYDVHINLHMESDEGWSGEYGFTLGSERRGEYRVKWERLHITGKDDWLLPTKNQETAEPYTLEIKNSKWVRWPKSITGIIKPLTPSPDPPNVSNTDLTLFQIPIIIGAQARMHSFLRNMSFYTIYPDLLREPQKPANPYPLQEKGENLASVLRELPKRNQPDIASTINEALEKVVEGVNHYKVSQVGGYLVTRLHHALDNGDEKRRPAFELAQESDGTLRMLGILTALYQQPPRDLLTIEEPEMTIHPGALGVLCDVIEEASTRSQILITTHHPDMVDRFSSDTLRVVEKVGGMTRIGPVDRGQCDILKQKLFSPGELMRIEGLRRQAVSDMPETE